MQFLRAIKLILTLHCDESERLVSESLDECLPWSERWAVRMHFVSCVHCRRLKDQLLLVRQAAQSSDGSPKAAIELPVDAKERIAQAIRESRDE